MDIFISGEVDKQIGEIYREIRKNIESSLKILKDREYGSEVTSISIIPIIVKLTPKLEEAGFFKERKQFSPKKKEADYRLKIDLNKFLESSNDIRRLMVIKNLIESIRSLGERAKKDFDAKALEHDILDILQISADELNKI